MNGSLLVCVFFLAILPCGEATLYINEFSASNESGLRDEDGDTSDWIEFYNDSDETAVLTGYSLSDDPKEPTKWVFPEVSIPAKGFLIVWASDKNRTGEEMHTNFGLSKSGEAIVLSDPEGSVVDRVDFDKQFEDRSYGRRPEVGDWIFFDTKTPGEPNSVVSSIAPLRFSIPGGFHPKPIGLEITTADSRFEIYYTIDCSTPTRSSIKYSGAITIATTTIIRARTFRGESMEGPIVTHSYFIEPYGKLPSLSLVVAPEDLNDASYGLLTHTKERGDLWERNASLEYLNEASREFGVNCGVRIHGGISRTFNKNSFRIYFSSRYGEPELNFPLFHKSPVASFKRLVLSAGSNDTIVDTRPIHADVWSLVRDALMNELFREAGVRSIGQRPARLYLNGKSWGIYWIKERIDKYFVRDHFGYDEFDLLKHDHGVEAKVGDIEEWEELNEFLMTRPLNIEENYETVAEKIDLESLIDNHIIEMWAGNVDWPHNNHYQLRPRIKEGKWYWIPWDSDVVLGSPYVVFADYDMYDHVSGNHRLFVDWSTLHFRSLLANSHFRIRFVRRATELLETVLNPSYVESLIEDLAEELREEISFETDRWGSSPEIWEKNVIQLIRFVRLRDTAFREHTEHFRLESNDPSKLGSVGILKTFSGTEVQLKPEPLFEFVMRQIE